MTAFVLPVSPRRRWDSQDFLLARKLRYKKVFKINSVEDTCVTKSCVWVRLKAIYYYYQLSYKLCDVHVKMRYARVERDFFLRLVDSLKYYYFLLRASHFFAVFMARRDAVSVVLKLKVLQVLPWTAVLKIARKKHNAVMWFLLFSNISFPTRWFMIGTLHSLVAASPRN